MAEIDGTQAFPEKGDVSFRCIISAADGSRTAFDDYVVAMINEWLSVRVYLINRPACTEVKNLPVITGGHSNQVANAESLR